MNPLMPIDMCAKAIDGQTGRTIKIINKILVEMK